ncbi:MAG TPA: RidA family protein [Moraxella sp.]|uniref:RidA family protein n=1 Tax=Faucicola osloensis TaxID=34062 RepID=UPI000EC80CFF|nr:RidA family protein [Moraxella osloensis]HCC66647.1 RidA family protein [Moraxella sp.]
MTAQIQRFDSNDYLSEITIFNHVVYLAGQVPNTDTADIHKQTQEVLDNIDTMLAKANSDKSRLLTAQIFIKDLADFEVVNSMWGDWLADCPKPSRATVKAELVNPLWKLEIVVVAAQNTID